MNRAQCIHACETLDLGTMIAEPQAIHGGLLHQVWRLETTQGIFALKQLHADIMQRAGIDEVYRLSERIAVQMAAQGIPAVAAQVDAQGEVLHYIENLPCIVYPWVEGETLSYSSLEPVHAQQIGAILAHIHSLHLSVPELGSLKWKHFHDDDWDILTYQAFDLNLPWAYPVRAAMPKLIEWTHAYEAVEKVCLQHLVVSHTDLDPKNVIWQDAHTPYLIDWEAAGWIHPTVELANVALGWSDLSTGNVREDIFQAALDGYLQNGGMLLISGLDAVYGSMGNWLGWLLFNMRRSLGECAENEEEQQLGNREATKTLAILQTLAAHAEKWAGSIDARR